MCDKINKVNARLINRNLLQTEALNQVQLEINATGNENDGRINFYQSDPNLITNSINNAITLRCEEFIALQD